MRIYLAGGFYKRYKQIIRKELKDFDLADPEGGPGFPGYYVGADLDAIRSADLVLAYQDEYPYVYGMAAEIGFAAGVGVPVIYVCTAPRVDSFLSGLSRAVFSDLTAACRFVRERYGPA